MHELSGITTLLQVTNWNLTKNEHYELFMAIKLKECPIKVHFSCPI